MLVTLRLSQSDVAYLIAVLCCANTRKAPSAGIQEHRRKRCFSPMLLQEELDQVKSIQEDVDSATNGME